MQIIFDIGTVVSVMGTNIGPGKRAAPAIGVRSQIDATLTVIPLAPSAWEQSMPLIGYQVLYLRIGRHDRRIIKFWGNNEETIRKGVFGLNEGEVFIQSPTGLGYLKIDQDGRVTLVGGDMTSVLEHGDNGTSITAPGIFLRVVGNTVLEMREDGSVLIQRTDDEGTVKSFFTLDKSDNIIGEAAGNISLKAKNIFLDGDVAFGRGASDEATRNTFGNVVTSGPTGTYPTDFSTGAPIPGSSTIKGSS